MCRETGAVGQHLSGTDIDTLTSMQPPTGQGGAGAGSPKLLSTPEKDGKGRVAANGKDSPSAAARPLFPRKPSGQSPRLLPYFPKPGVTSPPPPQSLARNADPGAGLRAPKSPSTPPSKTPRNPSPGPAPRAAVKSSLNQPSLASGLNSIQSSPPVSKGAGGRSPSSTAQTSRGAGRNPSPNPATRTGPASRATAAANNSSATPTLRSSTSARNPSPMPAPRSSISARNSSPAPRASPRNPSPGPGSRATTPMVSSPSSKPASSPLSANLAAVSSNSRALTSSTTARRSASPAVVRKDHPSRPSVSSDVGQQEVATTTPEAVRKLSILGSPPASSLDASKSLSRALSRSFKDGGAMPCSPDSLMTFSPVRKLSAMELQAQKKERIAGYGRKVGGPKSGRVACEGMVPTSPPVQSDTRKRCHWVTPQSEPDLVAYHDEVWGVPVHDDKLLFEFLVLEGAQSELTRPQMLSMRDYFRDVWEGFDPETISKFDEKKVAVLKADEVIRQPEAKLRGVIENAKLLLKIVEEFGSFDKYLWNFVGSKPIVNSYRLFTQIPVKSSKSETLSKDLMRRGFRYVGPTTVYSFMQATGMVNDHLVSCYRHGECCAISQGQAVDISSAYGIQKDLS